jgi:drug/metabolite transporter (DMT)-like permease
MIAFGSYILGLGVGSRGRFGFLAPLKALAQERGARLMLMVAALYSLSAALYKSAILHSSPLFFGVMYPLVFTGLMAAAYPWNRFPIKPTLESNGGRLLLLGIFFALSSLSLAVGMKLAPAAYIIAVKRLSLLMSVLLGGLWLKERPILPRIIGAALMCAGVGLIALRG